MPAPAEPELEGEEDDDGGGLLVDDEAGQQLDMHACLRTELSSSSEEEGGDGGGGGKGRGRGHAPRQSRSGSAMSLIHHTARAAGSVPVPPPPVPSSSGAARVRRRDDVDRSAPVFVQRRDERSSWPKVLHSVTEHGTKNYLRLSVTRGMLHSDMRAVCTEHPGAVCSLSRSCRHQRPLGLLWWWLSKGSGLTKQQHADLLADGPPTHAEREAARLEFESLDGVAEFLAAEAGGANQGEPLS